MKIVIAGAGEVGCHLAKMLSEGYHEITIIDNDEERLALVTESMDVLTVQGDPTSISVLKSAGVFTEQTKDLAVMAGEFFSHVRIECFLFLVGHGTS